MSDIKDAHGILDIIQRIASNRESGRLEICSFGTHGTLFFNEGRLVDARLGSLSGFQAVNAAVSLRDVEFSFDDVMPASHSATITPNERVVLKRFFGIEAAELEEPTDVIDPHWNTTPEQVVPLSEVEEIPQIDLDDTPTVVVRRVVSSNVVNAQGVQFLRRLPVAVYLTLLVVLAAGAVALIPKLKARHQSASIAPTVAEQSSPVPQSPMAEVKKESLPDSGHQQVDQIASKSPSTAVAQQRSAPVRSTAQRDVDVQDLTGEWKVINTVQKTAYKSYDNMEIGFRLKVEQKGKAFTARGEKVSENGRALPAGNRTPIRVTGSIDGDKVVADFIEDGTMRRTNGRFIWRLQNENAALTGTFVSAAANSSGKSAATRQE